jgi:hypothetical protein
MPAGRPLKFKTNQDLETAIKGYFEGCWGEKQVRNKKGEVVTTYRAQIKPYTITGLAVALDTTRETLLDYEDREEYSDTIKRAKMQCHQFAEESLFGSNATGPIFNLKNNYGWRDKTETDITTAGKEITRESDIDLELMAQKVAEELKKKKTDV